MSKAVSLNAEQDLRDRWMEILVTRPSVRIQDAMLMAAPIVDFIISGRILGVDQQDIIDEPSEARRTQRAPAR